MAERWHRPGDVLAAVAVVVIWSVLALVVERTGSTGHGAGCRLRPAVGNTALAVVGAFIGRLRPATGWAGTDARFQGECARLRLAAMAVVTGLGLGAISLVADRRIFRNPHTGKRGELGPAIRSTGHR